MKLLQKILLAACVFTAFVPVVHAEKFFGSSSVSLLYSDDYEIFGSQKESATVFTFENVTAHNWGDTFFFIDRYQVQGDSGNADSTYGEFAPRLSLSWLSGQDLGFGPVNDVYLATQYEFDGGVEANNYMYGLGLGWDIPGFQYFNTNAYYVENNTAFDTPDDWQLTVTWGVPFELGSALFLFDGFVDYSSGVSGGQSADLLINPQLKLDLGHFTGEAGVLYAGIEYSYWRNKFGSPNIDTENAVSALVKFHF